MKRRLSTLILEGAQMRPQAFGYFFHEGGSCALGAAIEAATGVLNERTDGSDVCTQLPAALLDWIELFNDFSRLTRGAIADWLVESGSDVEIEVDRIPANLVLEPQREPVAAAMPA